MRLAEESGDIYSRSIGHSAHGYSCYGRGALEEARDHLSKAVELGERCSPLFFGTLAWFALAETYLEIGEYEVAKSCCRNCIELLDSATLWPSWSNLSRMVLEKANALRGEKNVELERIQRYVRDNKTKVCEGLILRYVCETLLIVDDQHFSEAQHWIEEAIKADKRNQMMFLLGRDYAVYAELFKRKGDQPRAKEQLVRAIDIYKECGADGWVTKAEEELAKFS